MWKTGIFRRSGWHLLEALASRRAGRVRRIAASAAILLAAACTQQPLPPTTTAPPTQESSRCRTCPSPQTIAAEVARLRTALVASVPQDDPAVAPDRAGIWIALARKAIETQSIVLTRPQLLVVVDRNPAVQRLAIVAANPYGPWELIGGGKVSTGVAGVVGSFITPSGVFLHDGGILDYRALGTFNEYHIRGLGIQGMRVWDFGWLPAEKGWGEPGETRDIRMLVHATDPDALEPLLGQPTSQGCIHVSTAMNRFLDLHGVLDRDYEDLANYDPAYAAVLPLDREPSILAGNKLVIVDSLAPIAPPSVGVQQGAPGSAAAPKPGDRSWTVANNA